MGDSDDEYDRRRLRDKFRGERIEYEQRRPRGDYRERHDWTDRRGRENWSGGGGRDQNWDRKRGGQYYGRQRRESEGGDGQISPPMKRNRRDWDSSYDKGFNSGGMASSSGAWSGGRGPLVPQHQSGDPNKQSDMGLDMKSAQAPQMMTFKNFLTAQEENIDEMEAVRRYQEYKTEFRRTQLSDFFVLHKDEEWFKNKYHPVDAKKAETERRQALRRRLRIFIELQECMENMTLDGQNSDAIVKLLDTVAIKLEGGTTEDLAILDGKKPDAGGSKQKTEPAVNISEVEDIKPKEMEEGLSETQATLSPSSVPLPDEPPPRKSNNDDKQTEVADKTPDKKRRSSKEENHEVEDESHSEISDLEAEPAPPGEGTVVMEAESENENKVNATVLGEPLGSSDAGKEEAQTGEVEDAEPDPGPPGVDEEADNTGDSAVSKATDNSTESDGQEEKRRKEEGESVDEEKKSALEEPEGKVLETYLAMMNNKTAEENQESKDDQISDDPIKIKSREKEEKKGRKRNWESRKGTGLGAFVDRMGGEANEDSDSDSESESEEDEEEDKEKEIKTDQRESVARYHEEEDADVRGDNEETTDSREQEAEGRQLHKTLSLFMRSIPPKISKADISAVCKRYPGYLRVALADPNPERGFYRRGWVTFENVVNIKDICWNLSNIRIKDCELNPVVNRDLSKRIRPISGITLCKEVVRFDLNFSAKLVKMLDEKFALFAKDVAEEDTVENVVQAVADVDEGQDEDMTDETQPEALIEPVAAIRPQPTDQEWPLPNENPVLAALPENAAEPEKAENLELIVDKTSNSKENGHDVTRDEHLLKGLDKLLLYLRIVHSVDYYNGSDYPNEDEMPNRCGILHVRDAAPEKSSQKEEITEWKNVVEQKLGHFLEKEADKLSDEEVQKLGKKLVDQEVENFIKANTQEQAKDKWLCPLSGKKFRAKEFIRKHIFNKHADKVEAVKLEVDFFNNYLHDPKRPQFPEGKSSHQQQPPMNHHLGRGPVMMYGGPRGPFTPPNYGGFSGGPEMYNRGGMTYPPKPSRGGARDTRKVVQYKDLDAPDDVDFF